MSNPVPAPVPAPVQDFFARFLAKPDETGLRVFCVDLLDLEIDRANCNLFCDTPLAEASETCTGDMAMAERVLRCAVRRRWLSHMDLDLPHHWLTLLGHRLAIERGLPVGGIAALAHVACRRFNLPLTETEAWSEDVLFRQFTQTVLRQEWDYTGLQFRMAVTPPPDLA